MRELGRSRPPLRASTHTVQRSRPFKAGQKTRFMDEMEVCARSFVGVAMDKSPLALDSQSRLASVPAPKLHPPVGRTKADKAVKARRNLDLHRGGSGR
jgi:hypothetical protein